MKHAATIGLSLYTLIAAPLAAWYAGGLTATFVVVGALACGVFIRLPDLAELGIGPLKAKLEREVREAAATVEQLKSIGAVLGKTVLGVLAGEGRMGGMSFPEKLALKEQVVAELTALGLTPEQIRQACSAWVTYIKFDHAHRIYRAVPPVGRAMAPGLRELLQGTQVIATPEEWRTATKHHGLLLPEVEEAIVDYEYYVAKEELRRPELWKKRG